MKTAAIHDIESALPDPQTLTSVLTSLVESIRAAHRVSHGGWGLTLCPSKRVVLRFNVGHVEMFRVVVNGQHVLGADKEILRKLTVPGLRRIKPVYKYAPDARFVQLATEDFPRVYELIREAHFQAIEKAAEAYHGYPWKKAHSSRALQYIRELLGTSLPDPDYVVQAEVDIPFDPSAIEDARERTVREIVCRRGQPEFRQRLLEMFEGRCVISGCQVHEVLEAAHIVGYKGDQTNHPGNGLLLRADLHTLFDVNLIAIDPETLQLWVAPTLRTSAYGEYHGKKVTLPEQTDLKALRLHIDSSCRNVSAASSH